ncbi:MAG: glycosyltransferase [Gaiellaceae bacterium]
MNASDKQLVSVVIGSYNRLRYLRSTIDSVRRELEGMAHEIIVVDGGSNDGSLEWLVGQKDVITIVQHNRGEWNGKPIERKSWGYFMNLAFRAASGKYVCMLSDDCLVVPGAIVNGVAVFEHELAAERNVGAVAFYWRNWPKQKTYWVGLTFGNRLFVNHGLYLKTALERIGYVDEESYSFYHADGDLCLRLWEAGYMCIESPTSFIEHAAHVNKKVRAGNLARQQEDWRTYTERWGRLGDPEQDWKEVAFEDPNRSAARYWGNATKRKWSKWRKR